MNQRVVGVFLPCAIEISSGETVPSRLPDAWLKLGHTAPSNPWDETNPPGSGTAGVLFWDEGNSLSFSLDYGNSLEAPQPQPLGK